MKNEIKKWKWKSKFKVKGIKKLSYSGQHYYKEDFCLLTLKPLILPFVILGLNHKSVKILRYCWVVI